MCKLNIGCINAAQEKLLEAFEAVYAANLEKKKADAKQWELRNDPAALVAFQPEWNKAFNKRTVAQREARELVSQYPSSAANLLERLIAKQMEAQNAKG